MIVNDIDPFRGVALPTVAAPAGQSEPAVPERLTEPDHTPAPAVPTEPVTTEQDPEQTETFDVADHTIAEVMAAVDAGTVTADDARAQEQARGDDARPRLLAKLSPQDTPDL